MRKMFLFVLVVFFVGCLPLVVFAEGKNKEDMPMGMKEGPGQGAMGEKDAHKRGPMGSMMQAMMSKSMVATSDGGVVVLAGNRLLKYDKNLELVKEVKIKMESEEMRGKMTGMPMPPQEEGASQPLVPKADKTSEK